jgi:uncharacterized protein
MFGRILLIMALVAVALLMLRSALGKSKKTPTAKTPAQGQPKTAARLVHCATCGAHLAESDAIWKTGRAYCCAEHLKS